MAQKLRWLGPATIIVGISLGLSVRKCAGCEADEGSATHAADDLVDSVSGKRPKLPPSERVTIERGSESERVFVALRGRLVEKLGQEAGLEVLQALEDNCAEARATLEDGVEDDTGMSVFVRVMSGATSKIRSIVDARGKDWKGMRALLGAHVYSCLIDVDGLGEALREGRMRPGVEETLGIDLDSPDPVTP